LNDESEISLKTSAPNAQTCASLTRIGISDRKNSASIFHRLKNKIGVPIMEHLGAKAEHNYGLFCY